jgi:hypothetical protein
MKYRTFSPFKYNFQASLIKLLNHSLQDVLRLGNLKKLQNSQNVQFNFTEIESGKAGVDLFP